MKAKKKPSKKVAVKKPRNKTTAFAICCKDGGFGLSDAALERLIQLGWEVGNEESNELDIIDYGRVEFGNHLRLSGKWDEMSLKLRSHPDVLRVIRDLGEEAAAGLYCTLKVVRVPSDIKVHLEEFNGKEWIAEDHRTWD